MLFDTPHLIFREFTPDDLTALVPLLSNPEVMQHSFSGPLTQENAQAWLNKRLLQYEHPGFSINAVILKSQDILIGFCGIVPLPLNDRTEIELICRFPSQYWQYAQEAAEAMKDYAFDKLAFSRIMCLPTHPNKREIELALSLGMSYENDTIHRDQPVEVYGLMRFPTS